MKIYVSQKGTGHLAVYNTTPQSFIIKFSYLLTQQLWGLSLNFDWMNIKLDLQTFQPLNVI